jgi:hypothetical protein
MSNVEPTVTEAAALRVLANPPFACELRPCAFFLAWQGVLVLAFEGWPPPLAACKAALNAFLDPIKPESAGSKWPKTTLAATADGAPPLSLPELTALRDLCEAHGAALRAAAPPVRVDALSLVRYTRRGLEAPGSPAVTSLPLAQPRDASPPSPAEAARARATLSEWEGERLEAYLEGANRAGSRISTYREESPAGSTLVTYIRAGGEEGGALDVALDAFQAGVDSRFPGRFAWLSRDSLHATVRGLVW